MAGERDGWARTVPGPAAVLGWLGLIPFVVCAAAPYVLDPYWASMASLGLWAYGAVILSFLGGVQWGLAVAQNDARLSRLGLSVLPSLIAWPAVWFGGTTGFLLLALGFGFALALDSVATVRGWAPVWYPRLRAPLTITVFLSLIFGVFNA